MSPPITSTVFDVQNIYRTSDLPLPVLPQLKTRRLWDMVFTHGSYVGRDDLPGSILFLLSIVSLPNSNRIIAVLGYRILNTCVTEWLINADPGLTSIDLTVGRRG